MLNMSSSGGSTHFIKRRTMSSSASQYRQQPLTGEEAGTSGLSHGIKSTTAIPRQRLPRASRGYSISSGTSTLPSRSYIHNSTHGGQDVQYASEGVREQTAELSSSFMSDSDIHRHFEPDLDDIDAGQRRRRHESIDEEIEFDSPELPEAAPNDSNAAASASSRWTIDSSSSPPQPTDENNTLMGLPTTAPRANQRSDQVPDLIVTDEDSHIVSESTPLLPRERLTAQRQHRNASHDPERQLHPSDPLQSTQMSKPSRLFRLWLDKAVTLRETLNPKRWDRKSFLRAVVVRPVSLLPSVFLGALLNLLDALSYGIILFPLGEKIFSSLGPDGVSMFYVSCIVSQLVYSTGSIFRGGVGSEMIEVVPFFHKMTYMIMSTMGKDNPAAVRATTITAFAMSSILTGIIFFILGTLGLGNLVNFFPHSILVGCIGGVGIFLFLTGIEVAARLDGFEFTKEVFMFLVKPSSIMHWAPPLALAIILMIIKRYYDRPFLVPAYYIAITAIFYIITAAVPSLNMDILRDSGWVFAAPAADVPFYGFYRHYKFSLVDWKAIAETIPSQLALTFFGILHVPINVPNLAMKTQEDNVNINRELIMHGISNTLSGGVGSIQNYLVYVNSVLVMETGGDSRLAGFLLAGATTLLWISGPVVIGYVPVHVVATLIYYLGIDLTKEAIVDTYGRLHKLEYFTILVIALVMGFWDFVAGISIGIGLACLVYVVQTSRKTVIRAQFSGSIAGSTVRRHARQRAYLQRVGPQMQIVKLGGYLFFGSIVNVEKAVRALIDDEAFVASPIRYLVLDFSHVTGIDFSAAEAFARMNRILHRRDVEMILAGVNLQDEVGQSLKMDGLFVEEDTDDEEGAMPVPKVYETLNGALEACENHLLVNLTEKQDDFYGTSDAAPVKIPKHSQKGANAITQINSIVGSPRTTLRDQAATRTITEQAIHDRPKRHTLKQPLPLILHAFQGLTDRNEEFWFRAIPYFTRREFKRGQKLYSQHDPPDGFYLLQSGILRAEYFQQQGAYHESIVAGTTCGELPFFSNTERTSGVYAEQDCVAWLLTPEKWIALQREEGEVAKELLKVGFKLSAERIVAITSYILVTAS